jgi:hypothetical protein
MLTRGTCSTLCLKKEKRQSGEHVNDQKMSVTHSVVRTHSIQRERIL